MSSDLLARGTVLDVATPFSDEAVRGFDVDRAVRARQAEKEQTHLANMIEKKSELLASPDKIDSLVSGSLEDVFPLAKKPKAAGYSKVAGMDEALAGADHPMAGLGATVKDKFKAALKDKSLAAASPYEILDAVKNDTLAQKDEKGRSLLERAHEYKMQKDEGGLFSFHPSKFIPGMAPHEDKNTVALPGYQEYKEKNERASTSIPESFAIGAATVAVGAGLTALTGGAAAPALLARMAMAGAVAIPEFKVFDAAVNAVHDSDYGKDADSSKLGKLGAEMALGLVATLATHKVAKFGLNKSLTAAIEAGKLSEGAVARLKVTGLASDAIKTFEAKTAEVAEMKKVQSGLEAANAELLKKNETARKANELRVAVARDEAEMPMEEFVARLHDEHSAPFISPLHAEVMGIDEATLAEAKSNPVVLFSKIENPAVEERVMQRIGEGARAQDAVLQGVKEEASLRLAKQGRTMAAAEEEAQLISNARLGMPLGKGAKVVKGSGRDVRAAALDFGSVDEGALASERLSTEAASSQAARDAEAKANGTYVYPSNIDLATGSGKAVSGGNVKGVSSLDNVLPEAPEGPNFNITLATGNNKLVKGGVVNGVASITNDIAPPKDFNVLLATGSAKKVTGGNVNGVANIANEVQPLKDLNVSLVDRGTAKPDRGANNVSANGGYDPLTNMTKLVEEAPEAVVSKVTEIKPGVKGKTPAAAQEVKPAVNTFTEEVPVKDKKTGKAKVVSTVNTVGLAGAGILAGGMALFGTPEKSEASMIGEVGKVASEGKKLLDGGLEIAREVFNKFNHKSNLSEATDRVVRKYQYVPQLADEYDGISVRLGNTLRNIANEQLQANGGNYKLWRSVLANLEKDKITVADAKAVLEVEHPVLSKGRMFRELLDYADDGGALVSTPVKASEFVTELMREHGYNDVPGVLKSLEEVGIDTRTRIAYHGTRSAESTLEGYAPEATRAGLYNDEGEFAKYFTHDPMVSAGYSGVYSDFKWSGLKGVPGADVKRSEILQQLYKGLREKGFTEKAISDSGVRFLDAVQYETPLDVNTMAMFKAAGVDVTPYIASTAPNVQKSLLVVEKTYPMEGAVPDDVKQLIEEYLPHLDPYKGHTRNGKAAWEALAEIADRRAIKTLETYASKYGIKLDSTDTAYAQWNKVRNMAADADVAVLDEMGLEFMNRTPKTAANNILRELGYDSITHLGRSDGFVTIALKPGVEKPFFTGKNLADMTLKGVVAATASIPLLSLLSPQDAEASTGALAGKLVSEVVTKTLMEEIGGDVKNVFRVLFEKKLVSEQVPLGTTSLPQMQRQFEQAPKLGRSINGFNEVVGQTKSPFDGLARFMSTNFFSQVYGTTNKSVSVQLASMQNAMTNNINNAITVAKSIVMNVRGIKPEHSTEIAEFMKPIQAEYDAVAIPLRAAELETLASKDAIKSIEEALKDGKYSVEDAAALTQEHKDKIAKLQELWHEYNPKYADAEAKYNAAKTELIQKYPSARISFAIEEPQLMDQYAHLYTTEEKVAVAQFQEFYSHYKLRAKEVGMEVISGPYINHSRDNSKVYEEMAERLEQYGVSVTKKIPLTEFFSRSKYSKQMVPDISRNAFDYIPDTERRIQGADFWRKGRQDGWYAFSQNELIRSNKVWSEYFDRIKQSMIPPPNTTANQWANRYASVETLRLLAFLPSAPFKHLFKNEGTWATLGFTHSMKMIPDAVMTSARNTANEVLAAQGLTEKMLPKGALDDFARSMVKQRSMINPLADLERPEGIVSGVDAWLDKLNNTGGIGIRAVEAFDRTHTVQAALDMALKKGMTTEQAMYSIYDTILKNNFLGGSLNPAWMHNPKIRALALFQNTPFKIMERRLANAYKTGKDVQTAWGVIKSQKVEETLAQLMDLKAFVQSGQNEFKKNLIYDALTSTKDSMGNSVTHQFMKEFLITGAILGAGSATGVDFTGHSFHIPFLKSGTHEPVLATSPIVDASWKTVTGKPSPGHENDEEKEFFTARFLRHWLGSSGGAQPLLLHKFRRITADDIPEIYRDSPMRYLFSVPSNEHK